MLPIQKILRLRQMQPHLILETIGLQLLINISVAIDTVEVATGNPYISTSTNSFSGFSSCAGSGGIPQAFTLQAGNFSGDVTITAPTGYELSTTHGMGYSSSLTFSPINSFVNDTTVYVRLTSTASNGASGNITCSSSGISTVNIATGTGTVNSAASFTVNAGSDVTYSQGGSISLDATIGNFPSGNTTLLSQDFSSFPTGDITETVSSSNLYQMLQIAQMKSGKLMPPTTHMQVVAQVVLEIELNCL